MMPILTRYIGMHVIWGTLLALCVLVALFTFASFVDDVPNVGRGTYTVFDAMAYLLLTTPRRVFQLFPIAALIGSLIGLGTLAGNSELRVVRAAGVSTGRIVFAVMKAATLLMLLALFFGEVLAPIAEPVAQQRRNAALEQQLLTGSHAGLWVREGQSFIKIGSMDTPDRMRDVRVYEFSPDRRLQSATRAREASHDGQNWLLSRVARSSFESGRVVSQRLDTMSWTGFLAPEMVRVVAVTPETLSATGLLRYIDYLRSNGLESAPFEIALWTKLAYPLATGVMIFLAVPLVLGRLQAAGLGVRILIGSLLGIGFHIAQQTAAAAGVVFSLSPLPSVLAPMLVFLTGGLLLMRRIG